MLPVKFYQMLLYYTAHH